MAGFAVECIITQAVIEQAWSVFAKGQRIFIENNTSCCSLVVVAKTPSRRGTATIWCLVMTNTCEGQSRYKCCMIRPPWSLERKRFPLTASRTNECWGALHSRKMGPTQWNLCRHLFRCAKNVINMANEVFLHSLQAWCNPGELKRGGGGAIYWCSD